MLSITILSSSARSGMSNGICGCSSCLEMKNMINNTFWIVTRLDGRCMPKVRHTTYAQAYAEAQRLARLERGVEFHVAQVLVSYVLPIPEELIVTHYENK